MADRCLPGGVMIETGDEMADDLIHRPEYDFFCRNVDGNLGEIKTDLRSFQTKNEKSLERIHDRLDCLANKRSVSYPIAILIAVLSSSVVGLLVAFASKGFK
jgi:hypothetical protein